ncbi:MAG: hypothetical protein ACRENK_08065 [Gemmatimonadaceae bacterium]
MDGPAYSPVGSRATLAPAPMPKVTVKVPVSVELTDEQLEAAETVNDLVGVVVKTSRSPEVREVAKRVVDVVKRLRGRRLRRG